MRRDGGGEATRGRQGARNHAERGQTPTEVQRGSSGEILEGRVLSVCLQECPADGDDIRDEEDGGAGIDGGALLRLREDEGPVHTRCHIYTPANTCTRVRGVRTGATHETSNRHAVLVSCR